MTTLYTARLYYQTWDKDDNSIQSTIGTSVSIRATSLEEAYLKAKKMKVLRRKKGDRKYLDICAPPAPGRTFASEAMIIPPMPSSTPRS